MPVEIINTSSPPLDHTLIPHIYHLPHINQPHLNKVYCYSLQFDPRTSTSTSSLPNTTNRQSILFKPHIEGLRSQQDACLLQRSIATSIPSLSGPTAKPPSSQNPEVAQLISTSTRPLLDLYKIAPLKRQHHLRSIPTHTRVSTRYIECVDVQTRQGGYSEDFSGFASCWTLVIPTTNNQLLTHAVTTRFRDQSTSAGIS